LSVNPAPARILGYSVEEMLRIPMREMVPAEFRAEFEDYLNQIKKTGESKRPRRGEDTFGRAQDLGIPQHAAN
jgi:PAS domain S-box-containing protein